MAQSLVKFGGKMIDGLNNTVDKLPIIQNSTGLEYDTPYGVLLFTKKEVDYYSKLFELLDFDDDDEVF